MNDKAKDKENKGAVAVESGSVKEVEVATTIRAESKPKPAEVDSASEAPPVYVYKSSGRHNSKEFKKGEPVKGFGADVIKGWRANGVICTQKEFDALTVLKKSFRDKK